MAFSLRASDVDPRFLARQRELSAKALLDETEAVRAFLPDIAFLESLEQRVYDASAALITSLRTERTNNGIEVFLKEYGLDSSEGIAIMCLAEALLRIPDATMADRLIHSTFEEAQWEKHLGRSESWLVNASSWGLLLTGKVVQLQSDTHPVSILSRLVGKLGEPVIREALRAAMRHIGAQFVLGETIETALKNSNDLELQGFCFSYDMLGEGARSNEQAEHYLNAYMQAIKHIGAHAKKHPDIAAPSLSVKLSGLHSRYQLLQHERVMDELLPRLKKIVQLAMEHNVPVSIDAEESSRLDINILVFTKLFADPDFAAWNGIGFVVQAYQKRAYYLIDYLAELARTYGKTMPIRLVKGAYWDSEIKAAQIAGLATYPVFTRKEHTDISYLACAGKILAATDCFYPQFATHNARTICAITAMARHYAVAKDAFEFQRLHGMGEDLFQLIAGTHRCRIYAPVGKHKDLLAYLIRRLLENGANTSFVHLLMDDATPIEILLQDPMEKARALEFSPNPLIPEPVKLYGAVRKNSHGIDLGNLAACEIQATAIDKNISLIKPADTSPDELDTLLKNAATGYASWRDTPVTQRADILEAVADRFETQRNALISWLIAEGKKTIADAVAEVREAIDLCRYYAAQARITLGAESLQSPTGESNILSLHPRGIFVCISPWNFPLAIFTGQIAAALVSGNSVIAKPAEQTPCIAEVAVRIFHQCGVPANALQLAVGDGNIGAALVKHPAICGVCFTGSMEVAQHINRALATRIGSIIPFIAETGGQNCMVVDSSALLETAIDDIILSAFGSAGQRCSSLRVLYVQEDIADEFIALLTGAMQELSVGAPESFASDIGPVIDAEAQKNLLDHIARMGTEATLLATARMPSGIGGNFVLPHAFEIRSIEQLTKEIFGPVLHVIRYSADAMEDVARAINSTGYGLTFGIHSRIRDNIEFFKTHINAGNIYVNRSMIGATVGVQPFGGEGLSGTGPKAGGPHYLLRFVTERTVSTNTAAIGGNVRLLSGGS